MKKTITRLVLFFAIVFNSYSGFSQNAIDFGFSVDSYCEPSQITLTDFSSITVFQGPLEYRWYVDMTLVSTDQFPLPIAIAKGYHNVQLEIYDTLSILGSRVYSVEIFGRINDFMISPDSSICPGQSVHLSINTSTYTVLWNSGDNSYFTPTTSTNFETDFTYEKPGSFSITLITDSYCGTDTTVKNITVGNTAIPSLNTSDIYVQPACIKDPVSFSTYKNYISYFWEFGDGATSNLPQPQHKYNTTVPSDFTAKLTVTNQCGGSAFVNFLVQIQDALPAEANFDYESMIGWEKCPGTPIKFKPWGSGSYLWDFGDGTTSNEKNPVHQFNQFASYPVTLTVTNGCLNNSSITNFVDIYSGESWVPNPIFSFDTQSDGAMGQSDTIVICPGQFVGFMNQTYGEPDVNYTWDFGDGKKLYTYNALHLFPDSGIFMVSLTSSNLCGASSTSYKYVKVDGGALPVAFLNSIPYSICAGDKVYFFDDNFDLRNKYTYSVNFGDGNSATNIKDNADLKIRTLVSHIYATAGSFNYTFTATNFCGNSISSNGTIEVDNDPTRQPFYYVENSTENKSDQDPVDWSFRRNPTDYEIDIPVSWASWIPPYGNDFHVFLWYGIFDPFSGTMGKPNGMVHFNTTNIVAGVSVKAYIPVSQIDPLSIGIAAGYYCGGIPRFNDEPEAFGGLTQFSLPVPSIPIIPSGITDLSSLNMGIIIDPTWNGVCSLSNIEGTWVREVEPGVFAQLWLNDTGDGFVYEMKYTDAVVGYNKSNTIESGYYYKNTNNDSIQYYSYYGCTNSGEYSIFKFNSDTIQFTAYNEGCPDRLPFFSGIFTRVNQNSGNILAVCPGDKVQFKVVGGKTYLWKFGDGNTSVLQYPAHAYASAGIYNAFVIAINSCGRVDTLFTKVTVMDKPAENVFFWVSDFEKVPGDSLHFIYENYGNSDLDNNTYLWNFGDGNTSVLRNPVHVYLTPGDYNVSLTVTNGCGPASHNEMINVRPIFRFCDAQFDYSWDGSIYFSDVSIGNPTGWSWKFGDGSFSTEQNPIHNYAKDGAYKVTLTIFNPDRNCISTITKNVIVGSVACQADFSFHFNSGSGDANFTDNSTNATGYYWDFGDGNYSVIADPSHNYAKKGLYTVCLSIWNNTNGCQSMICKDILYMPTDNFYIAADFSYFNDTADSTLYLYDQSTANTTNWYWTLGDGRMLETQNPVYKYSKPGVYKVCLIATDNINSISASICKEVHVGDIECAVASDFNYFINPFALEVGFFSQASGSADKYFWTFGDGSSSTLENPSHQYLKAGYYEVTLVVRNSTDKCMDKLSRNIQVGNVNCRADFSFRVNPSDNTVYFKDDSKGQIDYYYWDFGDGTFSVEQNPENVYKKAGKYAVGQFVIDNFNNCVDYTLHPVQVGEINCSADFMVYIDSASSTAYFTNRNLGKSTALLWSFGDGSFSTRDNPVHVFPVEGLYSTGLNTYNFNTDCMDFYQEMLLIGGIGIDCNADFVYRVDPANDEVTFSNKSIGDIVESVWSFGDETDAIEDNPVHTYTAGGYFNVCLSVTNSAGIRNTGCKWIYIEGNPVKNCRANFMFTVDSTDLTAKFVNYSYGDIDKYTWNFGDSSPDSASSDEHPSHIFSEKGYYLVQLKVENTLSGCVSNEYKLLNIADDQVLKAAFGYEAITPDKKVAGYPVDLVSASSGDGATVEWDFGDKQLKKGFFTVMDSTHRIVTHYYQNPGQYEVCLRVTDPIRNVSDVYCKMVHTKNAVHVDEGFETSLMLNVYPNPFNRYTTINYSLEKTQYIEMIVFDQLGRKVETLVNSNQDSGNYQITWETKSATAGVYHLKMRSADGIITKQLVITK